MFSYLRHQVHYKALGRNDKGYIKRFNYLFSLTLRSKYEYSENDREWNKHSKYHLFEDIILKPHLKNNLFVHLPLSIEVFSYD